MRIINRVNTFTGKRIQEFSHKQTRHAESSQTNFRNIIMRSTSTHKQRLCACASDPYLYILVSPKPNDKVLGIKQAKRTLSKQPGLPIFSTYKCNYGFILDYLRLAMGTLLLQYNLLRAIFPVKYCHKPIIYFSLSQCTSPFFLSLSQQPLQDEAIHSFT